MPALITHQLIAEEVYNTLDDRIKDTIKDRQLYYFGAQGGDPFYLYKYMTVRKKINFGKALHRGEIYKTFSGFKDYLERTGEVAALSYVLGYITHYATDIIFHPFVYFLINKYQDKDNKIRNRDKLHYLIEGDLDVFLLQKYKGNEIKNYRYPLSFQDIQTDKIFKLFEKIYFDLCGEELNNNSFSKSIKRYFLYNKMLSDPKYKKQKFISDVEDFFNISHIVSYLFKRQTPDDKYINIENEVWHNLENPEGLKNHSAVELYEKSVELSIKLIEIFLTSLENKEPLKTDDFSTDFNIGIL
jgi:hypothetical protein